jgi:hypothetical protein
MMNSELRSSTRLPRTSFLPYPELVESGPRRRPWTIEDSNDHEGLPSNGITDKKSRRIFVPLEPAAEGVSIHELAHVHWSPEKLPRVRHPLILLQAVEDARINLALERIGLKVTLDREQLAYVAHLAAKDAKDGDVAGTLIRAIAGLGTEAARTLHEEVLALPPRASAFAVRWVEQVESRLLRARERAGEAVAPFRVARSLAKELARDLDRNGLLRKNFEVPGVGCCQFIMDSDDLESRFKSSPLSRYERFVKRARARGRGDHSVELSVGRMSIACPPLTIRQRRVLRAGRGGRRCATEGTRISRIDRFAVDRAIFSRPISGEGATVLIDTSGSMSLSVEQVEEIVRTAGGAAVVAIYSGREDIGELRIVARGDMRAENDQFKSFAMGNIVDLPALEWLAKQPEPRLWVSDGCVTGTGDEACQKVIDACKEITKRARIERVEDADDAVKAIAAMHSK